MKPVSVGRFPHGFILLVGFVILSNYGAAQPALAVTEFASPSTAAFSASSAAPAYLGAYYSDGEFRSRSSRSGKYRLSVPRRLDLIGAGVRPREVPGFVDLHPLERIVENYQPPARATKTVRRRYFLSGFRDSLLTWVYGREQALVAPQRLAVDSQGRVVVVDPGIGAVHVLDGSKSFRIAAGANRRLHSPTGIALDAGDNIYVVDRDQNVVVVFDREGAFVRDIGRLDNETLFHQPGAIAIDRQNDRLYLSDTAREVLFVLDLRGNILQRVGKGRGSGIGRFAGNSIAVEFNQPTEIALGRDTLAVLDSAGSRIRIFNLRFETLAEIKVPGLAGREGRGQVTLGMDSAGHVYVGNVGNSALRIYDPDGRPVSSWDNQPSGLGDFVLPSGLWVDPASRIYIADTRHRQIHVFQMFSSAPPMAAGSN